MCNSKLILRSASMLVGCIPDVLVICHEAHGSVRARARARVCVCVREIDREREREGERESV